MVSGAWEEDILTWPSYSFSYLTFFGIGFVFIVWRGRKKKRCLQKFWKYINGKIQERNETKLYKSVESSINLLAFWTVISSCLPSFFCSTNNLLVLIKMKWSPPQKSKRSQSTSKYLLSWPSVDTGYEVHVINVLVGQEETQLWTWTSQCQGSWQTCITVFGGKKNKEENPGGCSQMHSQLTGWCG